MKPGGLKTVKPHGDRETPPARDARKKGVVDLNMESGFQICSDHN